MKEVKLKCCGCGKETTELYNTFENPLRRCKECFNKFIELENSNNMPKLTNQEIDYLISLIEAEKETVNLLSGFRKPTLEKQKRNVEFNRLIDKIKLMKK